MGELTCNSKIFEKMNKYAITDEAIKDEVVEANVLYNNGKFYYASGESVGALVSYSCAAVLLNSVVKKIPDTPDTVDVRKDADQIMNSLLQVIQSLQKKVGSNKPSNPDEKEKDWKKICTKIRPLVFKKGGSDCIFYNDVAGLQKEKDILDYSLVYPLIYPNLYPKTSRGILIYGPAGTGKTYLVKAAVNELQMKDSSVGVLFFAPSPGDLKGKYVGETEKKIEELFRCASDAACEHQRGCKDKKYISIIFMDEMDAIAPDRDKDTTGLAVNSVNTLLQMMDGINSFQNVTVVGATNYPWNLDSAILRRFDTQILINVPNAQDLKILFNMEINRLISLEKDKSAFDDCNRDTTKMEDAETSELHCNIECKRNDIVDIYRQEPYSRMDIEYFKNNKDNGLIDGIVYILARDKFSNSDLSRLIKAATTNAGRLAVEQSLFYSTEYFGDYLHDRYISALTGLKLTRTDPTNPNKETKDLEKIKKTSIDILDDLVNNREYNGTDQIKRVIQINKPDFIKIEYGDYVYYNTKCLLYKNNDCLIQHYSIKDIYIKGHKSATSLTNWNAATGDDDYFKNVLGSNKETLLKNKIDRAAKIDMIISFDFTFKKTTDASMPTTLLPVSKDIISFVFQPIYNTYSGIQQELLSLQSTSPSFQLFKESIKTQYGLTDENIASILDKDNVLFLEKDKDPATNAIAFSDTTSRIVNSVSFIETLSGAMSKTFQTYKGADLDFYKYVLLNAVLGDHEVAETETETETDTFIKANESLINTHYLDIIDYSSKIYSTKELDFETGSLESETFAVKQIADMETVTILKHPLENSKGSLYLLTVKQYKALIQRGYLYDTLYSPIPKSLENYFIVIKDDLFVLLFRGVLPDLQRRTVKSLWNANVVTTKMLQLYINEALNTYSLKKIMLPLKEITVPSMGPPIVLTGEQKETEREKLNNQYDEILAQQLRLLVSNSAGETTIISTLLIRLLYDNYLFNKDQTLTLSGVPITSTNESDIPTMGVADVLLGLNIGNAGGKPKGREKGKKFQPRTKSMKMHKFSSKPKTMKQPYIEKEVAYHGGAVDPMLDEFIKWCLQNKESKGDNLSGAKNDIAKKTIFVKAQFNAAELYHLRRRGVVNDIFQGASYTSTFLNNLKLRATPQTNPLQDQSVLDQENDKTYLKLKDELNKNNFLLPICFNHVDAIGTISSVPDKTQDDKVVMNTSSIKLDWSKIRDQSIFENIRSTVTSLLVLKSAWNAVGLRSTQVGFVPGNWVAPFLLPVFNYCIGGGVYGLGAISIAIIISNVVDKMTQGSENIEDVIDDILNQVIFTLVTENHYLECKKFDKNATMLFLDKVQEMAKVLANTLSNPGAGARVSEQTMVSYDLTKNTPASPIDKEIKNKLVNFNIPMQSFYSAMTVVKSTYNNEVSPLLVDYYENRDRFMEKWKARKQ